MIVIKEDIARFKALCDSESYTSADYFEEQGIGIYKEKRLHKILKRTLCDKESAYEVKVGKYIADICDDGVITEIQCGSLAPLREKLKYYLGQTEYDVCVVHPLVAKRRIIRANKETGEIIRSRLSSAKEGIWHGLAELYPIGELLRSPRLSVRFMFVELEEYRFSEKMRYRKEGAYDREVFPTALLGCEDIDSTEALASFVPKELYGKDFTAAEFTPYTNIRGMNVYSVLNTLAAAGVLDREKRGRGVWYRVRNS